MGCSLVPAITVDPAAQSRRVGRTLMQAVMVTQRHRESPPSALCRRPTRVAGRHRRRSADDVNVQSLQRAPKLGHAVAALLL